MEIKRLKKRGVGFFTEETLNIVFAVVALVILIFLAVALYGLFTKKTDLEQARQSLKRLSYNVKIVENGSVNESEFFLESPSDWWVIAWPYQGQKEIPRQCQFNCVCICPIPSIPSQKNSLDKCDESGICFDTSRSVMTIYEAEPPGWFAKTVKGIWNFLGYETKNVPLDIGGPLPLKVVIEEGSIVIKKV